jgi:long-subunit fatty acid transport protein
VLARPLSARAVSTGGVFSGPANPSGSALTWNPATLATFEDHEWGLMLDMSAAFIHVEYERAGVHPSTGEPFPPTEFRTITPDPNIAATAPTPIPNLRLFFGGFSPGVLGSRWPEDGAQRYVVTESTFVTYAFCLGATYRFADNYGFAIGGGPVYGDLVLRNSIDLGAFANELVGADVFPLEDPLLDGRSEIRGTGWSFVTVLGAWARPVPYLRLGLGLVLPRGMVIDGTMEIGADDLQTMLPGFDLIPSGDIVVNYPMPWQLSFEGELEIGPWVVAAMFQWIAKSVQSVLLATVTEAEPDIIEGRQVSVKGVRDDWRVSARVSRHFGDDWHVGLRFGVDPRYVPDETQSASNLDFTTLHASLGAEWQINRSWGVHFTYSLIFLVTNEVTKSIFNPRAPRASGLAIPSTNGLYHGTPANQFVAGFSWLWGSEE